MPTPAAPEDQTRISVRLPTAHVEVLQKRAVQEDRTISAEIRRLVRHATECEQEAAAA